MLLQTIEYRLCPAEAAHGLAGLGRKGARCWGRGIPVSGTRSHPLKAATPPTVELCAVVDSGASSRLPQNGVRRGAGDDERAARHLSVWEGGLWSAATVAAGGSGWQRVAQWCPDVPP
eukprot:gene12359-biopygen9015